MCTLEKRGSLFILAITGDDEHRLNPTLIDSIRIALSRARSESESTGPAALITQAHGKFFSNGYDLSWALSGNDPARPELMSRKFRLLISELISLPMPTIAAVTGHASAAGFILALSHDYILMRRDRGFLYMNELEIGYKIPSWFVQVLRTKAASPRVWRDVVLTAAKITADMGVEWGLVDSACDSREKTVEAAESLGTDLVKRRWDGKVYSDNRRTVFADVLEALGFDDTVGDSGDNLTTNSKAVSRL